MKAIFKREFRSYFRGLTGYLILGLFLLAEGLSVVIENLFLGYPSFEYSLNWLTVALVVLIPLLSMRPFAGDRREHTDQLLATLPVTPFEIVAGKYLAAYAVFAIPTAFSGLYAILVAAFGKVNLLGAFTSLFLFLLLGGALLAMCLFFSSLTDRSAIAAIVGIVAGVVLYLLTLFAGMFSADPLPSFLFLLALIAVTVLIVFLSSGNAILALITAACGALPSAVIYVAKPALFRNFAPGLLTYLSPFNWLDTAVSTQIFDWRGVVYLVSFAGFFLFLTAVSVGKRRV